MINYNIKFLTLLAVFFGLILFPIRVNAQQDNLNNDEKINSLEIIGEIMEFEPEASPEAEATAATKLSSPSAEVEEKIQKKKAEDITETGGEQKNVLAAHLDENPIDKLSWHNIMQHAIRNSIERGLPANIIVILLIFPLIVSMIAASRHIIGLKGFGIYIPAVLSVAFVSTGITIGVIIFAAVLIAALMTRNLTNKLKMPYLPRTAMLLLGVSFIILALLMFSTLFDEFSLLTVNIFPVLIIILLTENFLESQLFNSQKEAIRLTLETLIIAIICSLFIDMEAVQKFIILRPELTIISTALINLIIGKYKGLRLLEYLRFSSILDNSQHDE